MLHKSFKGAKCKTSLKLLVSRTKLMKNKKGSSLVQMKRELAQLLESGQDRTARIRVEHAIREENTITAYDLIEIYCELIVARLPIIESQKTCPNDLKEAVSSLIFASPRCADLPELQDVRKHFTAKYGKEFITTALELRPNSGVSRMIVEKLSVNAPNIETKVKFLTATAKEHNVDWNPEAFEEKELKPHEDLLNGPGTAASSSKISVEPHNVKPLPTPERVHQTYVRFPEKNATDLSPSSNMSDPTRESNNSMPSASHPDSRDSENERRKVSGYSNLNDENSSYMNEQSRTMEFKDAASAARAAAESAERASMAARAAVELSSLENFARGNSVKSQMSVSYSSRREDYERPTKSTVEEDSSSGSTDIKSEDQRRYQNLVDSTKDLSDNNLAKNMRFGLSASKTIRDECEKFTKSTATEDNSSTNSKNPWSGDQQRYQNLTGSKKPLSDDNLVTKRSGSSALRTSNSIDKRVRNNLQKENINSQEGSDIEEGSDVEYLSSDGRTENQGKGNFGEASIKEQSGQLEVKSKSREGHFIDSREGKHNQYKKSSSSHLLASADDSDDGGGYQGYMSRSQNNSEKGKSSTVYGAHDIQKHNKMSQSSPSHVSTDDTSVQFSMTASQSDVEKENVATIYDDYGSEDDDLDFSLFSENVTTGSQKEHSRESPKSKSDKHSHLFFPPSSPDFSKVAKEVIPAYDVSDGSDSEHLDTDHVVPSRSPLAQVEKIPVEKEVVESCRDELKYEYSSSRRKITSEVDIEVESPRSAFSGPRLSRKQNRRVNVSDESQPSLKHIRSPKKSDFQDDDPLCSKVVKDKQKPQPTSRVQTQHNFSSPQFRDDIKAKEVPNSSSSESEQELSFGRLKGGLRNKGNTLPLYNRGPPKDITRTSNSEQPLSSRSRQTFIDSSRDEDDVLPRKNVGSSSSVVSRRIRDVPITSQRNRSSSETSYENLKDQTLTLTRTEKTRSGESSESIVESPGEQKTIKPRAQREMLAHEETRDLAQLGLKVVQPSKYRSNVVASENNGSSKSSSSPVKSKIRDNFRFSRDNIVVEQEASKPMAQREVLDRDENPRRFHWVPKVEESYNASTESPRASSSAVKIGKQEQHEPLKPLTRKEFSVRDDNPVLSQSGSGSGSVSGSKVEEQSNSPRSPAAIVSLEAPTASTLGETLKPKVTPQKRAPHVHPKLPDYESMAAHFASLRSNVRPSK